MVKQSRLWIEISSSRHKKQPPWKRCRYNDGSSSLVNYIMKGLCCSIAWYYPSSSRDALIALFETWRRISNNLRKPVHNYTELSKYRLASSLFLSSSSFLPKCGLLCVCIFLLSIRMYVSWSNSESEEGESQSRLWGTQRENPEQGTTERKEEGVSGHVSCNMFSQLNVLNIKIDRLILARPFIHTYEGFTSTLLDMSNAFDRFNSSLS